MTPKPRRGLTEQAADAAVDQACRMLRLPTVRAQFPDLAEAAAREQMSYRGFLAELLMAECDDRARRRAERRIKAAGFPREKSLSPRRPGRWLSTASAITPIIVAAAIRSSPAINVRPRPGQPACPRQSAMRSAGSALPRGAAWRSSLRVGIS